MGLFSIVFGISALAFLPLYQSLAFIAGGLICGITSTLKDKNKVLGVLGLGISLAAFQVLIFLKR